MRGWPVLDAYIIERIRREREEPRESPFIPLRIDTPQEPPPYDDARDETRREEERGSVVIDFSI
jgi:hypothetical protein